MARDKYGCACCTGGFHNMFMKNKAFQGRCQTDSNQSQHAPKYRNLCRTKLAPLGESSGAVELEILSAVEGAFLVEMVADRGMNGGEFL